MWAVRWIVRRLNHLQPSDHCNRVVRPEVSSDTAKLGTQATQRNWVVRPEVSSDTAKFYGSAAVFDVQRKPLKMKIKAYISDFKLAFERFCIHAGGGSLGWRRIYRIGMICFVSISIWRTRPWIC